MNILAIIPARAGSKGVPRKNIKNLNGKPLISYSIKSSIKCRFINKIVVSTDSLEISKISKNFGAEIIKRPHSLAKDDSTAIEVILHSLDFLEDENYYSDVVILLQPTSPLRTTEDIDNSIKLFCENDCDSVISVSEYEHSPYWALKYDNNYLKPVFGKEYLKKRRQDLPTTYSPNGAIFISTPQYLKKHKTFYSEKTIPYIMPAERSIDIDTELDFKLAEILLRERQ